MRTSLYAALAPMALVAVLLPWPVRAQVASDAVRFAAELSEAYAEIADRVGTAVVSIDVTERVRARRSRGGERERETEGVGAGFIVDPTGFVLTNNHVIDGAERVAVRLSDGRRFEATVRGRDPDTDLAVLEIDTGFELPWVRFGDSEAVRPGHLVLALGSPFGFENSVSAGIVSARNRMISEEDTFQRFIQTDAAINPGNSGGPLVNMAGEVIGINTAVITTGRASSGVGFALPSNLASSVYRQLVDTGRVIRGSIGISYNPDPEAGQPGVRVTAVIPGGPAGRAGIEEGDFILRIAGQTIGDPDALLAIVSGQTVGARVPVGIFRNGTDMDLVVMVEDRAELLGEQDEPEEQGPRFQGPPR